jgi:hypothetical protein
MVEPDGNTNDVHNGDNSVSEVGKLNVIQILNVAKRDIIVAQSWLTYLRDKDILGEPGRDAIIELGEALVSVDCEIRRLKG